jgi:Histidine kinase
MIRRFLSWLVSHLKRIYSRQRLRTIAITVFVTSLLFLPTWEIGYHILVGRLLFAGFVALTVFGIAEVWPHHLPKRLPRWVLQIIVVALVIPPAIWIGYSLTNTHLPSHWTQDQARFVGFVVMSFIGVLIAPWIAVVALLKQIRNDAMQQALAFDLQRSQFEKQALDARFKLLQAQVEPHFIFNTLANVRELVIEGAPNAAQVLDHLIAYLRAAVPRINEPMSTIGQELELADAYLNIMQMRMSDRLAFSITANAEVHRLACPPMTLLTLVENAMRHGIDPAEEGGRIDVTAQVVANAADKKMCVIEVSNTGADFKPIEPMAAQDIGLGTGLANLRERLRFAFGENASLTLKPIHPHGTLASVLLPMTE